MPEELTSKNKIEILSVLYGPYGCTALFVSGITSSIGKEEREAMQKAIASALATPEPPHITPNDADCKGCPERQNQGLVWTKERPTVPGWYWHRMIGSKQSSTMAYVGGREDNLRCESIWGNRYLTRFKGFEWAGPIPIPEEHAK